MEPELGAAVVAVGLEKTLGGRKVVDGVSLTLWPGEVYGLLGPNGAGKTTTLSMLCGLVTPDVGTVRVAGHDPRSVEARAALGVVPQDLALFDELTARDNLRYFGRLHRLSRRVLDERIAWALEQVGLTARARERVKTYSGGMKRRTNLAVALVHRPRVLLLDEPTVGVDPQSRNHLLELLRRLADRGTAIVYASHYMEEVEAICDRVGIVDEGRLLAEGRVDEVVAGVRPARAERRPSRRATLEDAFLALTGKGLRD